MTLDLSAPSDDVARDDSIDVLYSDFADSKVRGLWQMQGLLTPEPIPRAEPYQWAASTIRPLADRALELITIDRGGDRRVLACVNPGLNGAPFATSTLWAAVQVLGPNERAPAHRHSPAALRFVIEGKGVWTAVDGDPVRMSPGDLVLTPGWTFHEHYNTGTDPMLWLDVLDLPMVQYFESIFYEQSDVASDDTPARSISETNYGLAPGLLPAGEVSTGHAHSPLIAYRWEHTDQALRQRCDATGEEVSTIRFTDPTNGRDVMATLRCEMTRIAPEGRSGPVRQTGSQVLMVHSGTGTAQVGAACFDLHPGDIVAVPSWTPLELTATSGLDVFSVSDAPVLEALGLFRREER